MTALLRILAVLTARPLYLIVAAAMVALVVLVYWQRDDAASDERDRIERGANETADRLERQFDEIDRDIGSDDDPVSDRLRDGTFFASPPGGSGD